MRYLVHTGMPGCVPESTYPAYNLRHAIAIAMEEKRELMDAGYRVHGNIRKDRGYWVDELNLYIEIIPVAEETYMEWLEEYF